MKLQPVILAGGNGHRLWPWSQKAKPKQFIRHQFIKDFGSFSGFQAAILRNLHLGTPLVIASVNHSEIILTQLKEINVKARIIFEPESRNTAACTIAACYYAKACGFDSVVLIPCDHQIEPVEKYNYALEQAIEAVDKYKFCTIGIRPLDGNSNFGYIKAQERLTRDLYLASRFIEKPDKSLTEEFLQDANYFWNSGIYLFKVDYVLKMAQKFIPSITKILASSFKGDLHKQEVITLGAKMYSRLPSISFDNAISEKLDKLALIRGDFNWHEFGNWINIWNLYKKDENQNNIQGQGEVFTHDVNNSYIDSDAEKTVAIDLQDMLVIFKNGQLLVAKKNSADLIKQIVMKMS